MSGINERNGVVADIKPGNALQMARIPVGTVVHNIELYPGKGGQMCRAAGTYAQLVAKEGNYALLRLPSGEVRKVLATCVATVGQVGNVHHETISLGKAGRNRWLGRRPKVRGVAMRPNPYAQQPGGIVEKEMPIHVSNLMVVCSACGKATRVGYKTIESEGKEKKVRFCKKCNEVME